MHLGQNKKKILFVLRSSKTHRKHSNPQLIKISTKEFHQGTLSKKHAICPYQDLWMYFAIRPNYRNENEPLFIFKDVSPVMDMHMHSTLHLMLSLMGYQDHLYGCHSFHSGQSCDLLKFGVSVETIKKLGCWMSNIVYAYLQQWY